MSDEIGKQIVLLEKLLKKEDNKHCADCKRKSPSWASITAGVFICIKCAGVHVTKIKSVNLDKWPPGVANHFIKITNKIANDFWEYQLKEKDVERLQNDECKLQSFIRDKYERRRFANKGKDPMTLIYEGKDPSANREEQSDDSFEDVDSEDERDQKQSNSSNNTSNKSKGYQPQIALSKKDQQEKKIIPCFTANNTNLIDFNQNSVTQNKTVEVNSFQKSDLISFNMGNDMPTISSKKQSEFNFINNRKTNFTQDMRSDFNNNLIDIKADSIPVKLKALNENISKLYSNNEHQNINNMDNNTNANFSAYNSLNQPNMNIQNTCFKSFDNQMINQGPMRANNGNFNGYNQNYQNQNYPNGYNNTFNNQNNCNSLNNSNQSNNIPENSYNLGSNNSNYQSNGFNDYTFGLTPSMNAGNNNYLNFTDDKDKKAKKDDPFKNLVSFK